VALRSASGRTVLKGGEVEFEWAAGLQLSGRGVEVPQNPAADAERQLSGQGAKGSVIPSSGASELYLKENIFVHYFASDLPTAEAERLWASQRGASTAAFSTPSRAAAWKTIPSWYFISTGDQIITAASELSMAHRAHSHITIFHGGSHLTLISHPDAVTAVIASAICSLR